MDKGIIIKEVFEIAMHCLRNEEIFLKEDAMQRYIRGVENKDISNTTVMLTYTHDIKRAEESISQRRRWLYELLDKFYKE